MKNKTALSMINFEKVLRIQPSQKNFENMHLVKVILPKGAYFENVILDNCKFNLDEQEYHDEQLIITKDNSLNVLAFIERKYLKIMIREWPNGQIVRPILKDPQFQMLQSTEEVLSRFTGSKNVLNVIQLLCQTIEQYSGEDVYLPILSSFGEVWENSRFQIIKRFQKITRIPSSGRDTLQNLITYFGLVDPNINEKGQFLEMTCKFPKYLPKNAEDAKFEQRSNVKISRFIDHPLTGAQLTVEDSRKTENGIIYFINVTNAGTKQPDRVKRYVEKMMPTFWSVTIPENQLVPFDFVENPIEIAISVEIPIAISATKVQYGYGKPDYIEFIANQTEMKKAELTQAEIQKRGGYDGKPIQHVNITNDMLTWRCNAE